MIVATAAAVAPAVAVAAAAVAAIEMKLAAPKVAKKLLRQRRWKQHRLQFRGPHALRVNHASRANHVKPRKVGVNGSHAHHAKSARTPRQKRWSTS